LKLADTVFAMLLGFNDPEDGMNVGKTLFAQVMEFVRGRASDA